MKFLCAFEVIDDARPVDVITTLVQSKYRLISQQQEGDSLIKVLAEAPSSKTQETIIEELGQVAGCNLVKLAFADPPKETKREKKDREKKAENRDRSLRRMGRKTTILDITDEPSALAMIGSQYPRIAPSVMAYSRCLQEAEKSPGLQEIGRKVGASVYKRDFSLGSPLKLVPALSRELRPALKEFCVIGGDELEVRLEESPFCGDAAEQNCCDFVVGYIFGFLSSNPAVTFDSIEEVSCGAVDAHGVCTFRVLV